ESQKTMVSALGTLAAGLAGGLAGGDVASAVAWAQAGKNAVENNWLSAIAQGVRLTAQGCAEAAPCRNTLVEKGLGALLGVGAANTVLDSLSAADKEYVLGVAMSGKADLIEHLTPEQRTVYDYMVGQDQKGLITIFPQPDRDLTGGKLINPIPDENRGTTLTTPDKSGQQGISHTGNTEVLPETGGNTTVTPIPAGPNQDDLAYLAGRYEPNKGAVGNMGEFFKQPGFGREMKDNARKTSQTYQGQSVYQAKDQVGEFIEKGDKYYLDGAHKNHLEVFDSKRAVKAVLNLDGSYNESKTRAATKEGRRLPK
ncbi:VENN motif pre-toxin domain-containing protein, partial [Biostraticola tofi]